MSSQLPWTDTGQHPARPGVRARGVESTPIPAHLMGQQLLCKEDPMGNKACFYKAKHNVVLNTKLACVTGGRKGACTTGDKETCWQPGTLLKV